MPRTLTTQKITAGLRKYKTPDPGPLPIVLPTTSFSKTPKTWGCNNGGAARLELGPISIPDGDFCLHVQASVPNGYSNTFYVFALGDPASGYGNGNIFLGYDQSSGGAAIQACYGLLFTDDAGNAPVYRTLGGNTFLNKTPPSSNTGLMTGPEYTHGVANGALTDFFLNRANGVMTLWFVQPGAGAYSVYQSWNTTGAIAAKQAFLGGDNLGPGPETKANVGAVTFSRFFRLGKSLTVPQMEAIAWGLDPRLVTSFDPARGDRLWDFSDQPYATGAGPLPGGYTFDLIAGQPARFASTVAAAGIFSAGPSIAYTNQVRITNIAVNQCLQSLTLGSSQSIPLQGTYVGVDASTGTDCDIQVQLIDYTTNSTIYVPWTTVATHISGGTWSGTLSGITRQFKNYDIQVRKVLTGTSTVVTPGPTYVQLGQKFRIGVLTDTLGQSIMEAMRYNGSAAYGGASAAYLSWYSQATGSAAGSPDPHQQGYLYWRGWNASNGSYGYGETYLIGMIADNLGCAAGSCVDAAEGSKIESWLATGGGTYGNSPYLYPQFLATQTVNGCRHIIWNQGQGSDGDSYSQYYGYMSILYAQLKATMTSLGISIWFFHVLPLGNDFGSSPGNFDAIRDAQMDWTLANIAAEAGGTPGVTQHVVLTSAIMDLATSDGTHPAASLNGGGRYAERVGETIVQLENGNFNGGIGYGCGPMITASDIAYDGNVTITITPTMNGGATGLTTPSKAFTISSASGTSMVVSASTAGQLLPGDVVSASGYSGTIVSGPSGGAAGTYVMTGVTGSISSSTAATATGTAVTGFTAQDSLGNALTIASANITGSSSNQITLVLASAPTNTPPNIAYQAGRPGNYLAGSTNLAAQIENGIGQPVYDNRAPYFNSAPGYPLMFTSNGSGSPYIVA